MEAGQVEAELDRLSPLPFEILLHIFSFVPFKFAVRASVLARCFSHLWVSSPSIDLARSDFRQDRDFIRWTDRCFDRLSERKSPLVSFSLEVDQEYQYSIPTKTLRRWLTAAESKGLRHLSLCLDHKKVEKILPFVLSFHSLESLSINKAPACDLYRYCSKRSCIVFPKFNLIHLKSLDIRANITCYELSDILRKQKNLEHLSYFPQEAVSENELILSSPTVKILKMGYFILREEWGPEVKLSFPKLESLDLEMSFNPYVCFNVNMPLLRNARIHIPYLQERTAGGVGDWLRSLINVEELDIFAEHIFPKVKVIHDKLGRKRIEIPFHPLVEEGKDLPTFPNLKRLKLSMCFHELAVQDLVCFLHKCPVLQSLHLVHRDYGHWISRLPVNSKGNNKHAYFDDLDVGDNKIDLVTKLIKTADDAVADDKLIEPEKTKAGWDFVFDLFKSR